MIVRRSNKLIFWYKAPYNEFITPSFDLERTFCRMQTTLIQIDKTLQSIHYDMDITITDCNDNFINKCKAIIRELARLNLILS